MKTEFKDLKFDIKYLSNQEWFPSDGDKEYMPLEAYLEAVKKYNEAENEVLFKDICIDFDSDGDEFNHWSWPYQIRFLNHTEIECFFEDEGIYIENNGFYLKFPSTEYMTLQDFIDGLNICKVQFALKC